MQLVFSLQLAVHIKANCRLLCLNTYRKKQLQAKVCLNLRPIKLTLSLTSSYTFFSFFPRLGRVTPQAWKKTEKCVTACQAKCRLDWPEFQATLCLNSPVQAKQPTVCTKVQKEFAGLCLVSFEGVCCLALRASSGKRARLSGFVLPAVTPFRLMRLMRFMRFICPRISSLLVF